MDLKIFSPGEQPGVCKIVQRQWELKHLSFTIVELGGDLREHEFSSGEEELSLDFYTGAVRVEVEGPRGRWSADVGARATLAEPGPMIYVPAGSNVKLTAPGEPARISVAGALGKEGGEPVIIQGNAITASRVGKDNWTRMVYTHIADNVDAAHLIAGETVSQPGGWTSCPPHKHDTFSEAGEVPMEEIYYFQIQPRQGFAMMRVYTEPDEPEWIDSAMVVQHGDAVLIPRGYHPVVACPGYTVNYTWVLAGEGRTYGAWRDDPRHAWIKD